MRLVICLINLISLMLMTGCSNQVTPVTAAKVVVPINEQQFDYQTIEVTTEQELLYLTPEQKQSFLRYFNNAIAAGKAEHEAISDYLLARLANFNYYGETYTASQAMALMKGNCMSLAILTAALANLVGVEMTFREVITLPVFEKQNNLILSSIHVQTKLYNKATNGVEGYFVFNRPGILVDYFPNSTNVKSRYLTFNQFIAMYYKNIASDALIADELDRAFAYAQRAYEYDSANNEVMNLLAVIHRRKGDETTAEQIYQTAMQLNSDSLSILNNYSALLVNQGRSAEAKIIQQQMARLDDPNPYSWLDQAYLAQSNGKERQAIAYFKKTIELAPYVKPAYIGLYQVYMAQGKEQLAKATLANALEWTHKPNERKQLKYKLYGRNSAVEAMEKIQE